MTLKAKENDKGRPASFDREELVKDVMELFWTHGYNKLSLNFIAQEVGLKRSSLYNSFKTKEGLFTECLQYYRDNSPAKCLNNYRAGQKVAPMFHKMFDEICEIRANDKLRRGCLAVNTFSELAGSDSELSKMLLKSNQARLENMMYVIECAINQKELPASTDANILTNIILSFMSGLSIHSKKGVSKIELQNMSKVFLEKMGLQKE